MIEVGPRRLRRRTVIASCGGVAAAAALLGCAWVLVPRWWPEFTMEHSPWVRPVLRAAAAAVERDPHEYGDLPGAAEERLDRWKEAALPAIEATYASRSATQRRVCIAALQRVDSGASLPPVALRASRDPDPAVRRLAIDAIASHSDDPRIVPTLLDALGDGDEEVRRTAARAIGALQDPALGALVGKHDQRIPALALFLNGPHDIDDEFRFFGETSLAERLVAADDQTMMETLRRGLRSPESTRRRACAELLGGAVSHGRDWSSALMPLVTDADPGIATAARESIVALAAPGAEDLFADALAAPALPLRELAVEALSKIGTPEACRMLGVAASSGPSGTRLAALFALTRLNRAQARPLIMAALADPDERIRGNACAWVDSSDLPSLLELMPRATGGARTTVISALASIADPSLEPTMIGLLGDSEPHVRWLAANALATYGSPTAREPLERLLSDPANDSDLRVAAVAALTRCGEGARAALVHACDDEDPAVAQQARASLKAMGNPDR